MRELLPNQPINQSTKGKSMAKKMKFSQGAVTVTVTKNNGEYRARVTVGGIAKPDSDYFTDWEDDAIGTAKLMLDSELANQSHQRVQIRGVFQNE